MVEVKSLTVSNWTPDIVASLLGVTNGILLGWILGILYPFVASTTIWVVFLFLALAVSYAFERICFHMELSERRHFQQAFTFMVPALATFYTIALVQQAIVQFALNRVNGIVGAIVPFGAAPQASTSIFTTSPSHSPGTWTFLLGFVILIPFIVHSLRQREFKPAYLLYVLIPLVLCYFISLIAKLFIGFLA